MLFITYFSETSGPLTHTSVPGIVGLSLGLSILSLLLCLMFRLFSTGHWARSRRYNSENCAQPQQQNNPSSVEEVERQPKQSGAARAGRQSRSPGQNKRTLKQSPPEILLHEDDMGNTFLWDYKIERWCIVFCLNGQSIKKSFWSYG